MRKHAPADRWDRKAVRLSLVGGGKTEGMPLVPLEAGVQTHIGNLLRAMYDSALDEPVPQRFLALLRELDVKAETIAEAAPPVGFVETK